MNLTEFHHSDRNGNPVSVYDAKIFEYLKNTYHLMVIGGIVYIYKEGCYQMDTDGAQLKTEIRKLIFPHLVKSTTIKRIYDLFLMDSELQEKPENVNKFPKHWIPFRNGYYDPVERCMMPHSPTYRCTNQIPHDYDPSAKLTGKAIDEWLEFIAPDENDREMLLEFIGYCMTTDTRQQKFLILIGVGGSGKSTLIKLLESIIGAENISNISLSELNQRFASFGLMNKLLNSCADLEITALEDTSLLKKILGEDTIRAEAKGKDAIFFKSYAKLLFSTNELPLILNERSNGFFRRLLILRMDRQPSVPDTDFFGHLEAELPYLIQLSVKAVQRMYKRGMILISSNCIEAVQRLRNDSDTVSAWLDEEMCTDDKTEQRERTYLYQKYSAWCERNDRQSLKRASFYRSLETKRLIPKTLHGARYYRGICEKKPAPKQTETCTQGTENIHPDDDSLLPF